MYIYPGADKYCPAIFNPSLTTLANTQRTISDNVDQLKNRIKYKLQFKLNI